MILLLQTVLSYASMALPIAFAGIPIYILLPDFYATQHQVSLSSLGLALLLLRIIDSVQDPYIGWICDRYSQYRRKILIITSIVFFIAFFALFFPLIENKILWFFVTVFIVTTCYSVFVVNLNTIASLSCQTTSERTRLISARETVGLLGVICAVTLPYILQSSLTIQLSYAVYSIIFGILLLLCGHLFFKVQWNYTFKNTTLETYKLKDFFSQIKNIKLYKIYFLSTLAASFPAVLVTMYVREILQSEQYTGAFLLVYFLSGIIFMPVWKKLSNHFSHESIWLISMIISAISFIFAGTLGEGDIILFLLVCVCSGFCFGADLLFPATILSNFIEQNKYEANSTILYGNLSAISKFSLAIASFISLTALDFSGTNLTGSYTDLSLTALSLLYAVIPSIIKGITAFWFYTLIKRKKI